MNNLGTPTQLPVNVREALEAICAYGKGRCWYCDGKLPSAPKAIRDGWDVQRIDGQPVASIILVCPPCLREKQELGGGRAPQSALSTSAATSGVQVQTRAHPGSSTSSARVCSGVGCALRARHKALQP